MAVRRGRAGSTTPLEVSSSTMRLTKWIWLALKAVPSRETAERFHCRLPVEADVASG